MKVYIVTVTADPAILEDERMEEMVEFIMCPSMERTAFTDYAAALIEAKRLLLEEWNSMADDESPAVTELPDAIITENVELGRTVYSYGAPDEIIGVICIDELEVS